MLVYRRFAWFVACHYCFWLRAAPVAYDYFAYEIFLLIAGALLKYDFDIIATLIELELSDSTVLSP
jgi:hypothetical protein